MQPIELASPDLESHPLIYDRWFFSDGSNAWALKNFGRVELEDVTGQQFPIAFDLEPGWSSDSESNERERHIVNDIARQILAMAGCATLETLYTDPKKWLVDLGERYAVFFRYQEAQRYRICATVFSVSLDDDVINGGLSVEFSGFEHRHVFDS